MVYSLLRRFDTKIFHPAPFKPLSIVGYDNGSIMIGKFRIIIIHERNSQGNGISVNSSDCTFCDQQFTRFDPSLRFSVTNQIIHFHKFDPFLGNGFTNFYIVAKDSAKISAEDEVAAFDQAQADLDGKNNTLENQKAVLDELIAEKKRMEAQIEAAKAAEIQASLGDVTGVRTTELEYVQYGAYSATEEEVTALAVLIYCEAGNQGAEGQLAVGAVVMNRIRDPRFAQNDIMSVIRASGQFSPVTSGRFDLMLEQGLDSVTESCYTAARRAIAGESNVGNRVFFRTYANSPSLSGLVIGAHIFSYTWNFAA